MSDEVATLRQDIDRLIDRTPAYHIVFLHQKLRQRYEDIYLIDIASALEQHGHKVTIFTNEFDEKNALQSVHPVKGDFPVYFSGWWLPSSICGAFRRTMLRFKSIWMAWRMIIYPPHPKPKVIILDTDALALLILKWFSNYKTIYIKHFPQLHCSEFFHKSMQITPDLLTAKTIGYADAIVVETRCLKEVFRKSFPKVAKNPTIIHSCVDTGLWNENTIAIKRIIPDLPRDRILFVAFGTYTTRTNFRLILDALEYMFSFAHNPLKERIHTVIAGHCSERSLEERLYYSDLINSTKSKPYASQITFLKQLPTVHKKTLIKNCTAVVHPSEYDVYPGPILAAMSLGRPVIAANSGFAADVLMHRLTGILVEPDAQKFGKVMYKLATSPTLQTFIGDMARNAFNGAYCFDKLATKLNNLVLKQVNPNYEILK